MVTGIMSQWSEPQLARFGEYSEEFVMLWALALATARKHFPHIVLVTDSHGAKLFQDFPYDEMYVDLDQPFIPQRARRVWAAGKFMGFLRAAQLGKPFVNFDGDVILRNDQRLFHAPILAQCEEHFHISPKDKHEENLRNIYLYGGCDRLPVMPAYARFSLTRERHTPFNMGICGGSDLSFWEEYASQALSILRHPLNEPFWSRIAPVCASLFVEQYLVGALADKRGQYISTLFPYQTAHDEEFMQRIGYMHLLGDSKRNPSAIQAVYDKMERHYPWLYDVVCSLGLKRDVPIKIKDHPYYCSPGPIKDKNKRSEVRSATYFGIAEAIADQWGSLGPYLF